MVKYKYKIWRIRNVMKFEWWNINVKYAKNEYASCAMVMAQTINRSNQLTDSQQLPFLAIDVNKFSYKRPHYTSWRKFGPNATKVFRQPCRHSGLRTRCRPWRGWLLVRHPRASHSHRSASRPRSNRAYRCLCNARSRREVAYPFSRHAWATWNRPKQTTLYEQTNRPWIEAKVLRRLWLQLLQKNTLLENPIETSASSAEVVLKSSQSRRRTTSITQSGTSISELIRVACNLKRSWMNSIMRGCFACES